jgi:hypothetical protein
VSTGSRYQFELAREEDDPELRAQMAAGVMEGDIAITFRREPSYFGAVRVYGEATQVIKCVDTHAHRIVGLGCRSTLPVYINGTAERVGYLSDLRSLPSYRGGTLLARGFKYLKQLHDSDPVPLYLCVIYEGNEAAVKNLAGARAGLPNFRDVGRLLTPAVHLDFPRKALRLPGVTLERGSRERLPAIVGFLNEWQQFKQFAPVYRESDFATGRFRGLQAEHFLLAIKNDAIIGTVAAWDQSSMRQTHIERYSRRLAWVRPAYNFASRFTPLKPLPHPGARIPFLYFACMCARDHHADTLRVLLRAMYNSRRGGPWHYAIVGFHESDPYSHLLEEYRRIEAAGRVYMVYYPDGAQTADELELRRPYYVEASCI